jgi:hypothetical protein
LANLPYVRDVVRGTTRPHRGTWLIWCVLSVVVFASQRADAARWSLVLVGVQFLSTLIIAVLSVRRGEGGGTTIDVMLLGVAGLGVVGWWVAGDPTIATMCVVIADVVAVGLMIPKTYRDPSSETLSAFVLSLVSVLLAGVSVGSFNPRLLLYPAYLVVADLVVIVVIVTQRRRLRRAGDGFCTGCPSPARSR